MKKTAFLRTVPALLLASVLLTGCGGKDRNVSDSTDGSVNGTNSTMDTTFETPAAETRQTNPASDMTRETLSRETATDGTGGAARGKR